MNATGLRSVTAGHWPLRMAGFFLVVAWIVAACSPGDSPTAAPTQPLILSTATFTPTPLTPSATPPALPAPEDIITTPSANTVFATTSPGYEFVRRAIAELATELALDPDSIQLLRVESATWTNLDLGCGDSGLAPLNLTIDGYRLVLQAGGSVYEYHTDNRSTLRRCEGEGVFGGSTDALLDIDPIAAEFVALAQRRVAVELDLSTRRVRLIDVVPVSWPDTSLGCPLPDQVYAPVHVDGYRIVLEAAGDEYLFHTDAARLVVCDPEREQLPASDDQDGAGSG